MSTTAQQVFDIAMALIDEVQDDGTVSVPDTVTYNAKTPSLLNILQSELLKPGDLFSTYEIANKPLENLLGYKSEFDIKDFTGDEFTCEADGIAQAYYFEVDRVGTVYVEDYTGSWNTLATVSTTNTPDGFTAYKGTLTPTSGATRSRLRFTGTNYYRSVNRGLFDVPFASSSDIPAYRPWVKHQMPSDFKSVDQIVREYADQMYSKDAGYKWEGKKDLYIDYYFEGNIRIVYHPIPALITALTDSMSVDDITARTIVPYGLAAHLLLTENPESANFFQSRYEELKAGSVKRQPAAFEEVTDVYGGFYG